MATTPPALQPRPRTTFQVNAAGLVPRQLQGPNAGGATSTEIPQPGAPRPNEMTPTGTNPLTPQFPGSPSPQTMPTGGLQPRGGLTDVSAVPRTGVTGSGGPTFSPIDSLFSFRGTQIMPGNDPRLSSTRANVDAMGNAIRNADFGTWRGVNTRDASTSSANDLLGRAGQEVGNVNVQARGAIGQSDVSGAQEAIRRAQASAAGADPNSPEARRARQLTAERLETLSGPNRGALAQSTFNRLRSSTEPEFQREVRDVGRKAAAWGQMGGGMTTTNLADVQSERERFLAQEQARLADEAAGMELSDRLASLAATQSAGGQFAGEDLNRANFGLNRGAEERANAGAIEGLARRSRDEAVGERDFAAGQDLDRARLALERAGLFSGLSDQTFGQGQALRGEERGERDSELGFLDRRFQNQRAQLSDLSNLEDQQFQQGQDTRNEFRDERDFQQMLERFRLDDDFRTRALEAPFAFAQGNPGGPDGTAGGGTPGGGTTGTGGAGPSGSGGTGGGTPLGTGTVSEGNPFGFASAEEAEAFFRNAGIFGGGGGTTTPGRGGGAASRFNAFADSVSGTGFDPRVAGQPAANGVPTNQSSVPLPTSQMQTGGLQMRGSDMAPNTVNPVDDESDPVARLQQRLAEIDANPNAFEQGERERLEARLKEAQAESEIPFGFTRIGRGNATTAADGRTSQDADFWFVRPDQANSWFSGFDQGNTDLPAGAQFAGGWSGQARADGPETALGTPWSATDFDWLSRHWQDDPKLTDEYMRALLRMAQGG